jgi:hypothetical protein
VAIDVHGSEDQAKDVSTAVRERAFLRLSHGRCMHFEEHMRTNRSLPQLPLDIRCRRCGAEMGGDPFPT